MIISPHSLLEGFRKLLTERLIPSSNKELIEMAVVTLIWSLVGSEVPSASALDALREGTGILNGARSGTISEAATDACLLVWSSWSILDLGANHVYRRSGNMSTKKSQEETITLREDGAILSLGK